MQIKISSSKKLDSVLVKMDCGPPKWNW